MASSTPTVLNTRRVTELKNVRASFRVGPHRGAHAAWSVSHRCPERPLHHRILQDVVHIGHGAVDVDAIERQSLGRVGLGPEPVALLEPFARPAGDRSKSQMILVVRGVDRRHGASRGIAPVPVADLGRPGQIQRRFTSRHSRRASGGSRHHVRRLSHIRRLPHPRAAGRGRVHRSPGRPAPCPRCADRALYRGRRHRARHLARLPASLRRRGATAYGGKRRIVWLEVLAGEKAKNQLNSWLPDETLAAIAHHLVAIKGPLTTPVGGGFRSLNVALRQKLDLYACVRPVRWFEGVPSPVKAPQDVNMVIFRENTEDIYAGIEYKAAKRRGAPRDRVSSAADGRAEHPFSRDQRDRHQAHLGGRLQASHPGGHRLRHQAEIRRA